MSLPRVPIETTFKKVREFLFAKTSGKQTPWEHTSLVGEFYFNPDTIYDGAAYSLEAYSDNRFRFSTDSKIKGIVDGGNFFYRNGFAALRAHKNDFIALFDLIISICNVNHQLIHTDTADDRPGLTANQTRPLLDNALG